MSIIRARTPSPLATGLGILSDEAYNEGPRINLRRSIDPDLIVTLDRREDCKSSAASNTCEKPVGSSAMTLPIVLGIVIPIVVAIITLLILHRRNVRRERMEDIQDPNIGLDFGLGDGLMKKPKRKSSMFGGEKGSHKAAQLSMDMNLSSPYLLPPGMHGSRESIHSLARTLHTESDPYRSVAQYGNSDAGSIQSFNQGANGSSFGRHSSSSKHQSKSVGPLMKPPRTHSMPKSPTSTRSPGFTDEKTDPFASPTSPKPTHQSHYTIGEAHHPKLPVQPIVPEIDSVSPNEKFNADEFEMPDILPPPPVASKNRAHSPHNGQSKSNHQYAHGGISTMSHTDDSSFPLPGAHEHEPAGLGIALDIPSILSPGPLPHELEHGPLYDQHGNQPPIEGNTRGRHPQRQPPTMPAPKQRGLGVPQQETKRLSVGYRPLPPAEVTESEDPEFRANRIRSFYKEYFDDLKEAPPPLPIQQPRQQSTAGYYEDHHDKYLGEAAYYDAETNAFVMPYAQPVTRRAMTPPPVGRSRDGPVMAGPRGGPRGPHGSLGGTSPQGGGRPRAGSAFGPRLGSSASGRLRHGQVRKNMPPPSPLSTLPTPSKLKDDSFSILNAVDFAPPNTFRDHVAGRSQSPLGERRAYQPIIPSASLLGTAFDELAALPSPHMLQQSLTLTNLDFAPPKKFKDGDNMSDAGSIKSNKSGISAVQLNALRGGAGRVSRLPGDTVFTAAAMESQLKPSWTLRS